MPLLHLPLQVQGMETLQLEQAPLVLLSLLLLLLLVSLHVALLLPHPTLGRCKRGC
jgi:hypothetical protein